MIQGKVEICGVNTAHLPTMGQKQMMALMEKAQKGDKEAKNQLVESNLKLVLAVVQRVAGRGENADDLFQVGCIGLMKAISNFDTSKNVRFSTYGVPMIAGELRRYLRDYSPIRVSRSLRDTAYRVLSCKQELTEESGTEPTLEQVSQKLGIPLSLVHESMDAMACPISLYEPVAGAEADGMMVMDQVKDLKNTDERWIESITLRQAVQDLSQREKQILSMRFSDGKTQMEVASVIGISQAQVSRLEKGAIRTIRKNILPS